MSAHTRQEADLWRQRATVEALIRAAEKAEDALLHARPASASSIENWQASGGVGPMPGLDSLGLARLQENAIRARRVADAAQFELTGK